MKILILLASSLGWIVSCESTCTGISIADAWESPQCLIMPTSVSGGFTSASLEWLANTKKWNVVMISRGELYRQTEQFVGHETFKKMTDEEMIHSACILEIPGKNKGELIREGYGGIRKPVVMRTTGRISVADWICPKTREYLYTSSITFHDNQNFLVTFILWNDGLQGFTVSSPHSKLPENLILPIRRHLIHLGFNPRNFVELCYEHCGPQTIDTRSLIPGEED